MEEFFVVAVECQWVFADEDIVGLLEGGEEASFGVHVGFGTADVSKLKVGDWKLKFLGVGALVTYNEVGGISIASCLSGEGSGFGVEGEGDAFDVFGYIAALDLY